MTPARSRAPLTSRRSVAGALARFWKRSYAADYLSLLLVVGVLVLVNETNHRKRKAKTMNADNQPDQRFCDSLPPAFFSR